MPWLAIGRLSAQEAVENIAQTERVIVTGSNIPTTPTAAEVGPNPVEVIDRGTIEQSAGRTSEQLLRDLPIANANGAPISGTSAFSMLGSQIASVSLRGFDAGATLVLINGRRMVAHPTGVAGGFQLPVDLNTIPRYAIDTIEVLKDGASSIYGADAIAGVVNIKLRHNYQGAELNLEYGNTTNRDSGSVLSSLTFGLTNDKTSVTGVLSYYSRNAIFSRDRAYDRDTPISRVTTNASPYNLEVSRAAAEAAAGRPIEVRDANGNLLDTFFARAPFFSRGDAPASSYTYSAEPTVTFPINRYAGEFPDTERYGAYLNAEHKIFGEQLVAYADLFFNRTDLLFEQAPPGSSFTIPGQPSLAIPPHAPGATLGGPSYVETGVPSGAYNPFNPFQQIIAGNTMARLFDFGNRKFDFRTDAFFADVGIRGEKVFGTWGYDVGMRYSRIESPYTFSSASATRFDRILNAADPIFNPALSQYIGTTTPYNPFADYRTATPNDRKLIDYASAVGSEKDTGSLLVIDATINNPQLFHLPGGDVGFAFGGEFQHETIKQAPGVGLSTGDLVGDFLYVPIEASRNIDAIFGEVSIPIFGANFTLAGFHALELTASGRYEEFRNNNSNIAVPKLGLRWQPFDDSFTIRATWGEGYKQPTLVELYFTPGTGALDVFDPVKSEFRHVPVSLFSNPNLQAEDSRNFTAGFVYSPKYVPGLTITVDFFDIETTGWPEIFNFSDTLTRVAAGNPLPFESAVRDANGDLVSMTASVNNTGSQRARGLDLGLSYQLQTAIGTFASLTQVTYLDSFLFSPSPEEPAQELVRHGVDSFSEDAYLQWRGTSRLNWAWREFGATATTRYYDGFREITAGGNEHWVRATWLFDLQLSYELRTMLQSTPGNGFVNGWPSWRKLLDRTTLKLGCNNLFDQDPPRSNDNFPRAIYDPTGRFIYFSLTKKF